MRIFPNLFSLIHFHMKVHAIKGAVNNWVTKKYCNLHVIKCMCFRSCFLVTIATENTFKTKQKNSAQAKSPGKLVKLKILKQGYLHLRCYRLTYLTVLVLINPCTTVASLRQQRWLLQSWHEVALPSSSSYSLHLNPICSPSCYIPNDIHANMWSSLNQKHMPHIHLTTFGLQCSQEPGTVNAVLQEHMQILIMTCIRSRTAGPHRRPRCLWPSKRQYRVFKSRQGNDV